MDILDDTIVQINDWFEQKRKAGETRHYRTPLEGDHSDVEDPEGDWEKTTIILREDTQLELGHPSVGSCSVTLATHNPALIDDGRITLIGPDIQETEEKKLPFAQIIIASIKGKMAGDGSLGGTLEVENTSSLMDRVAHLSAQTEGYMIRSLPNLIWARVSKDAAQSGFSLHQLGTRLINALKGRCENIIKCEIFFVTSTKADVTTLDDIAETARAKLRKLEKFEQLPDGEYECTEAEDCDACPEQVVCDNIRDVIKIRKGDRVITFGEDEVTVITEQ